MADAVRFIHKNGKIIPIRDSNSSGQRLPRKKSITPAKGATGAAALSAIIPARSIKAHAHKAVAAARVGSTVSRLHSGVVSANRLARLNKLKSQQREYKVKSNKPLDTLGLGLSIATGVIGAATFASGTKGFLAGAAATHAIDAVGIGVNVASVKGKGHAKERVKQGAKQEARNLVIGNAVFAAGLIGMKKNRQLVAGGVSKLVAFGKKALARG